MEVQSMAQRWKPKGYLACHAVSDPVPVPVQSFQVSLLNNFQTYPLPFITTGPATAVSRPALLGLWLFFASSVFLPLLQPILHLDVMSTPRLSFSWGQTRFSSKRWYEQWRLKLSLALSES